MQDETKLSTAQMGLKSSSNKTVAAILGEIIWIMSRSERYKYIKLFELERLIMIPILLKQFKIGYKMGVPSNISIYAFVSDDEYATLLRAGSDEMLSSVHNGIWHSGKNKIEIISIDN